MTAPTSEDATELLVPLDGREGSLRLLPMINRIADRLGLHVRLLTVSDDPAESETWLRTEAAPHFAGNEVAVTVLSGDPAEVIIAEGGPTSVVCMATAATLRPHKGHVGSVAEAVVRGLERPVLLLGPGIDTDPNPIQRVIVPVDGSDLSEEILDVAAGVAKSLDVELWVVSVIPSGDVRAAGMRMGVDAGAAASGYVRRIANHLSRTHGVRTGFDLLHIEDPAKAILDFAEDEGLVVMTTHGRSGMSRLFAGSVAHSVVSGATRPVVVYRPPDEDV